MLSKRYFKQLKRNYILVIEESVVNVNRKDEIIFEPLFLLET